MNRTYIDNPPLLKRLMKGWFLKGKLKDEVNDIDGFTLFDSLLPQAQESILSQFQLLEGELPVFCLTVDTGCHIINTTHRFIRLQKGVEIIMYADFRGHTGFKSFTSAIAHNQKTINVKKKGSFDDFGLMLKTGEIIYWTIPTGSSGFSFWNATKRCGLD